jgi:hypothetical protein
MTTVAGPPIRVDRFPESSAWSGSPSPGRTNGDPASSRCRTVKPEDNHSPLTWSPKGPFAPGKAFSVMWQDFRAAAIPNLWRIRDDVARGTPATFDVPRAMRAVRQVGDLSFQFERPGGPERPTANLADPKDLGVAEYRKASQC